MMFHGYIITSAGVKAGNDAIANSVGRFGARMIGEAILPHVRTTPKVWPGATRQMAACAAADQLIFDQVRAGKVKGDGVDVGTRMWRRKA